MLLNNGGNNAKAEFFSRKSTYTCRLVMTSPKIQIAKKLSILTAQLLNSIEICLEIMVVTMRSRNFVYKICRLVVTSPKIQIAKKLSILTAQPLKSIEICLEIMVVTMRSRNFFHENRPKYVD